MAEALVSFLLDQLGSVVITALQEEVNMIVGAEEEVKKLTTTFRAIQTVLNDAEQKQIEDKLVKLWLEEFKEVAYEMDDVLDEWKTEILRSQIDDEGLNNDDKEMKKKVSSYLCSLCSCFNKVVLRHDIGSKIKEIRERLDFISSEKDKFRLTEINRTTFEQIETSSIIDTLENYYGRDSEKASILSRLLGESSTKQQENEAHHPQIISIIGMGGLGKTTLAQLVYNDDQVKKHFEKKIWVCVSDSFDLKKIAKAIIEEAGESIPGSSEWNALHHKLCDTIKGKRFLLVLDDVWNEDQDKWNPLKLSLQYGAKESRVLVTTRNVKVAETINSTFRHNLGVLSDHDCQLLLCRIAFVGREKEEHTEVLKRTGFEIAKKCKGLPLAAKTLGSLLCSKRTESEWRHVLESEIWDLKEVGQKDHKIEKALMLSYYHLPSPLKSCFAYCAIFPKDHKIKKETLIKLWMAQNFLSSESIGEEYFKYLAARSFFDFSEDDDGSISSCKMHDLVHDFARYLARNDEYVTQNGESNSMLNYSSTRHLNLMYGNEVEAFVFDPSIYKSKNLRTFQVLMKNDEMNSSLIDSLSADLFCHLRSLRVLNVRSIGIKRLPSEIDKLIHLRYLDLSNNENLKELPNSMTRLYNLQTLKLEGCSSLWKLPEGMDKMVNLRHLEIKKTHGLKYLPATIGKLTSLRTLHKFIVGGGSGGCKIRELKGLNCLEGYLEIRGLGRLETVNEASEAELKTKQQIRKLNLVFDEGVEGELEGSVQVIKRMEGVLEILQPHPNLVKLSIELYQGSKFPRWIAIDNSTLATIRTLVLFNCSNLTELPALGKLPSLSILRIEAANKVTHIGCEFYGIGGNIVSATSGGCAKLTSFPKLETFIMVEMQNLEEWNLGVLEEVENYEVEIMPCVTYIELDCKKLKVLPALGKLPSLEELEITTGEVTYISREFYGISVSDDGGGCSVKSISFPKLETLKMHRMEKLKKWDFGLAQEEGNGGDHIMPCVTTIELNCEKLKELPALGTLPSLKYLKMATRELKNIGRKFYGIGGASPRNFLTSFPKLESLIMTDMKNLEEWDLDAAAGEDEEKGNECEIIMPCVSVIILEGCEKLKVLPALGKLPSLVSLFIKTIGEVTQIGREFYGIAGVGVDSGVDTGRHVNLTVAFPKLIYLCIEGIKKVEEWDLGVIEEEERNNNEIIIMPRVEYIGLMNWSKLKALRVVAKLRSLRFLSLYDMEELEEFKTVEVRGEKEEDDSFNNNNKGSMLPSLFTLNVDTCPKLKSVPHHLPMLDDLCIESCSSLSQLPTSIPNLTTLEIVGLPESLLQISDLTELRRIYPNLTTLETSHSNSLVPQLNPRLDEIRGSRIKEIAASANIVINWE